MYTKNWSLEWLPRLSKRHKWTKTRKDLKPGDVVLVINPNLPRRHWPLGRLIEVFPGKDGHVRIPKVLLGQNVLVRPISKLCIYDVYLALVTILLSNAAKNVL
jgi:hypothetical protein